jgi:hypothetical protein
LKLQPEYILGLFSRVGTGNAGEESVMNTLLYESHCLCILFLGFPVVSTSFTDAVTPMNTTSQSSRDLSIVFILRLQCS